MAASSELGTLSVLPREIRDRIYANVLDFNLDFLLANTKNRVNPSHYRYGGALLRTSRRIHDEAIIILYQVNALVISINQQYNEPTNFSIMDCPGYSITFTKNDTFHKPSGLKAITIPKNMLRHIQAVLLHIGSDTGVNEVDIVTHMDQTIQGPERPTFRPVVDRVKEVCELLKGCDKIHQLAVSVYSNEETPGSIERVLDPIRELRGVQSSFCSILQAGPTMVGGFCLRRSFELYLSMIMAMPKGTKAPEYAPRKWEENLEHGIFQIPAPSGGLSDYGSPEDDYDDFFDPTDPFSEQADFDDFYAPPYGHPDDDDYRYTVHGSGTIPPPPPVGENHIQTGWGGFGDGGPPPGMIQSMIESMRRQGPG